MPCFFRPGEPWPIVPAKKMPGHARALPVRRLGRQPALAERRDAERPAGPAAGVTKPVAAITSSTSNASSAPPSIGRVRTTKPAVRPAARCRSIEASRIAHAAAQDVVLERLDVARPDADQRVGVDRQLRRRRRGEDDPARPRQEPGRELEAGVLLADDEDALAGVRLRRPRVGVVGDVLDARASAGVYGSATPTAKTSDLAAVLAVGRLEHERVAVRAVLAARRRPAAAVADRGSPVRSANVARFASISGRDGKYEVPSMSLGHERRGARARRRAGCSSRSARRRASARSTGAYGLVHDSSRWKNGQRRNIPPGAGSAEMTACSTPRRRSE